MAFDNETVSLLYNGKEHETNPPSEDPEESGLPDEFHDFQPQLLRETLRPVGYFPETISH